VNLRDSLAWLRNPFELLDSEIRAGRLTFEKELLVPGRSLITGDSALIEEIRAEPRLAAGKTIRGLRSIMGGDSMIMLSGPEHTARRRMILPYFEHSASAYLDEDVRRVCREELAMHTRFSAFDVFQRISLRTILMHLFGRLGPTEERAMAAVSQFLKSFESPLLLFFRPLQLDLTRYSPWGRALYNRRLLVQMIEDLLAKNPDCTAAKIARTMQENGLSQITIQNEILALILFGHDTGAAVLSWTAAHIFSRRHISEELASESHHEPRPQPGEPLLRAENFAHACVLESMRLTPPVIHLTRRSDEPVRIGGILIPPGTAVLPCMYVAGQDERVFENPREYRPDRFLRERGYSSSSFFPFGFGSRLCAGRPFVLRQMQIVVSELARFRFRTVSAVRPVRRLVLMLPESGCILERIT